MRLAGARRRPQLHRHQIRTYEHRLEIAANSTTMAQYRNTAASAWPQCDIARAEQLDRYHNARALHVRLHQQQQAVACDRACAAIESSKGPADLIPTLCAAEEKSFPETLDCLELPKIVSRLVVALLYWTTETDEDRSQTLRHDIQTDWQRIADQHRGGAWTPLCQRPNIRQQFPFSPICHESLNELLQQALGQ